MNDALPGADRPAFWRWLAGLVRPAVGWVLIALGALSIFLGWYGVSGQSLTSKQLPYLVSGGLTGIALIVVAAVFITTDSVRRQVGRLAAMEDKVETLYALLVDSESAAKPASTASNGFVALPTGTSYHRPGCALVAGKADLAAVDAATIETRGLQPCGVCDPKG